MLARIPRLGDTRLPVVHERGELEALDGRGEIGVVEDDRRRLATEHEGAALELLPRNRRDLAPSGGRAGEGDLVDAGMTNEVLADFTAGGHDADHALGHARFFEQLRHEERVERRFRATA